MNIQVFAGLVFIVLAAAGCETAARERMAVKQAFDAAVSMPSVTVQDCHRVNLGRIFESGEVLLTPEGDRALESALDQVGSESEVVVEVFPSSYHPHARGRSRIHHSRGEFVANRLASRGVRVVDTIVHPQPRSPEVRPSARVELVIVTPVPSSVHSLNP